MKLAAAFAVFGSLLLCLPASVVAAEHQLAPDDDLQSAIEQSKPGDVLILSAGRYIGNFVIPHSLTLQGQTLAIIDSDGYGHALQVRGQQVAIKGLTIQNWGQSLGHLDAGIFVEKTAQNIRISHNQLHGDGFGIWLDSADNARVISNQIQGNPAMRSADRGNGIHLSNVTGALIEANEIWHTRDGIYIEASNGNRIIGNQLHDLRYGIHYMYSYANEISHNHTLRTRTGYALMQSKQLNVHHNLSEGDQNYGMLMNFITDSRIADNWIDGVLSGRASTFSASSSSVAGAEGKAIFMYNSLFNQITHNLFSNSDLGIHLTAGSEDNQLSDNAFVGNKEQVKYVANRRQEWSYQGRGNYWSDYLGWDMNDDGIGDTRYEPNDGVDRLLWKYPAARILMNSPAVETLRWVQRQFPVLRPAGVVDSHPLMHSPITVPPS